MASRSPSPAADSPKPPEDKPDTASPPPPPSATDANEAPLPYLPVNDVPTEAAPEDEVDLPPSIPYSPVYPFPSPIHNSHLAVKPKRAQCKNACTNCQKACKKCDDSRPCQRCVRYGSADTCTDSKRKERKKGMKRGPYKKRDNKTGDAADVAAAGIQGILHGPAPMPYVGPVGYPPGMWGTYAPGLPTGKFEHGAGYYQPMFALTPVSGPPHAPVPHLPAQHGETPEVSPTAFPHMVYPTFFTGYPFPFPPPPAGAPSGMFMYPPPGAFHFKPPMPPFPLNSEAASSTSDKQSSEEEASKDPASTDTVDTDGIEEGVKV